MRTTMIAATCLALAGCAAVSVAPTNEQGSSVVLKLKAAGSALLYKPETLIDRAVEVGSHACTKMKSENGGTVKKLTSADLKDHAKNLKAALDVFGTHDLSMTWICTSANRPEGKSTPPPSRIAG